MKILAIISALIFVSCEQLQQAMNSENMSETAAVSSLADDHGSQEFAPSREPAQEEPTEQPSQNRRRASRGIEVMDADDPLLGDSGWPEGRYQWLSSAVPVVRDAFVRGFSGLCDTYPSHSDRAW